MRKTLFILAFLLACMGLNAQDYQLNLHNSGSVIYQNNVNAIEEIRFQNGNPANMLINQTDGTYTIPVTQFDSITFSLQEIPPAGDTVYITYSGSSAQVTNPFSNSGVTVNTSGANVTVNSTMANVPYVVSGTSDNGSLTVYSSHSFNMTLSSLSLTSSTTAAINLASPVAATLYIRGISEIADNTNSSINGVLYAAGNLTISNPGSAQHSIGITGNAKHGILVEGTLTVDGANIAIHNADSDGIHGSSDLIWNDGLLNLAGSGSDGLDFSGDITIQNGNLSIHTTAATARSVKVSGNFTMNGGCLFADTSGEDSKGIKADSDVFINGDLHIVHTGDMSKGLKVDGNLTIAGGWIEITSYGSTVMQVENNQNVPAYCTAIKCDNDINITGGYFEINLPESNHGGKGISADGTMTIDGATMTITTQGNGAAYTVSGNNKDAYTCCCLRSEGNMSILSGNLTLSSSGTGGKGINVGDDSHTTSTLTLGTTGGDDEDLILNVTTSGERITITSGGGGGWPPGGGGDYANPKGIKSRGNLTINSGTIVVHCTQTQNEGGECIESKATLTINGGNIEAYSVKDDAVNAAQNLTINGGIYYAHSDANDGTDSNGTMFINGGFNISNGSRMPEEGFDCDWNQFKITGSTSIGTGGGTSDPTQNVCTQPSLKINTQHGYAIQILKSDGTVICTYQCPTFTGGGGGGPGGGGNSMVMLFTDPQLQTGNSYTVKYGGTISGGDEWHGYYTGNVTYTGGQSVNVNVNSMYTTVSAGGGGW